MYLVGFIVRMQLVCVFVCMHAHTGNSIHMYRHTFDGFVSVSQGQQNNESEISKICTIFTVQITVCIL